MDETQEARPAPVRKRRRHAAESPVRDIALLLGLVGGPGRDILHGISTAARRMRCRWRMQAINASSDYSAQDLAKALAAGPDGVIAIEHANAVQLSDFGKPLVMVGSRPEWLESRKDRLAFVHFEEEAVGRAAAAFLFSLGRFRTFAFVQPCANWLSKTRFAGFGAFLGKKGAADVRLWSPEGMPGHSEMVETLAPWLAALPKPAAVMAAHDGIAVRVLDAAHRARLRVPQDMVLVGADDDEMLCETAEPSISSVALDHVKLGELAATALRRLLANPGQPPFTLLSSIRGVVERASARPVAPAAALAERAVAFIRKNATKGIGAADVAVHLGVSRSLADLRLRQVTGESALGMIQRIRLDALAEKLRTTDLTVGQAAASCGFGDISHAGRLFRRRFGRTMRDWRRSGR